MVIEVPDWCVIGKWIEWSAEYVTGNKWAREKILSYGVDGFFHQGCNCPVYYTRFTEYGKTIRECVRKV